MSGILYDVDASEQWRERLQREQQVRHSLRVAADRAQVRRVLREIAREIEGLAAGSTPASAEPVASRRQRLASLLPKPARLSPHEERAQLRRQFGLEP